MHTEFNRFLAVANKCFSIEKENIKQFIDCIFRVKKPYII